MTKEELLVALRKVAEEYNGYDQGGGRIEAGRLLLRYINDKDIEEAYRNVGDWYA